VISVASNLIPREVSELTRLSISGQLDAARELNRRLTPVFKAMFIESNPIPVKAALAMNGMIEEIYRLPMCPLGEANRRRLEVVLQEAGVLSPVAVAA
jgi:4-hydroxy-tetrahydrodipicolinate synthase